jgi:hypothetical protein
MKADSRALIFLVALALTACGSGGSGSSGSPPAVPTVQAVSLDANQQKSLEPLADGAQWTYQCDSGASPQISSTKFGTVFGAETYTVTWPVTVGRGSSSASTIVLANDSSGNLSDYGSFTAGTFTSLPAAVSIESVTPTAGATYTFPDVGGGTVTSTFQTITSVTAPSGSYSNVYEFHNTYSRSNDITFDFYDVHGIGTVRFDYTNGSTSDRCLLRSVNIVALQ